MTSSIVAGIAACLWVLGIWLWLSRSNDNHQHDGYVKVKKAVEKEHEALRQAGDPVALEQWYKHQIKRWTKVEWLHWGYARFLQEQGKADAAISILKSFIRRARRLTDADLRDASAARMILVQILLETKRTDEAERAAKDALAMPAAHPQTPIFYARIARDRGDLGEAVTRYLAALERFPNEDAAAKGAVDAMLAQGLTAEAEAMLRQQMKALPRAHALAILYARLAQDRGDLAEAAERWAYVREQFVFRKEAYTEGAEVLRKLGRPEEAEAVLASRPVDLSERTL